MIVFAVCDDDTAFAGLMARHLRKLFVSLPDEIECHVRTFFSANQVLNYVEQNPIHVLLLDIDMPDKNGFELAEALQKKSPSTIIVFVSAYETYVYDSFKYTPFGFLRKDHLKSELDQTIQKVLDKYLESNQTIIFSTVDGDINIRIRDIVYIESVKNYYEIHSGENTVYRCRGTLSSAEEILQNHSFYRIHTAFLVNMSNIGSVSSNRNITLTDGTALNASLRKWKGFHDAYMEFARKRVILT